MTNLALAGLLVFAVASGFFSYAIGTRWTPAPATVHGAIAIAILLLAPWKSMVVRRGLRRRHREGRTSLLLSLALLVTLASGLLHSTGLADRIGPLSVMQIHVGAALLSLPLAAAHYRRHPLVPRRSDLSRRTFLRTAGLTVASGLAWLSWESLLTAAAWPGKERRFTGSHQRASMQPEDLPVTSWLDDRVQHLDPSAWRLATGKGELSLRDITGMPQVSFSATLDCTGGWYSNQIWTGVRLDGLVDAGESRSFEVRSATGYARRFPVRDLSHVWLVTALDGRPLAAGHGFPARLVAPHRRGYWWVKWVVSIRPSSIPWWVQSPFPLT
jgi:hypothetical protein